MVVGYTFNVSTWEAKVGGSLGARGQRGLQSDFSPARAT